MDTAQPYLSLVVAARNDDHGGNMLARMQTFVNAWIGQCKRHGLSSELIVVEWNPPAERPRLTDALRWPSDLGPCQVRFIEVPPEIHRQFKNFEALPLHQMIAKNVGVRRARGEFVLATNIDIILSDELVRYLAERRLEKQRMYRIDRYDIMSEVPVDGSLDEQLSYCQTHLLRVFAREGAFNLTPGGRRLPEDDDIIPADAGVSFGPGWFPVERYSADDVFRWVENDAQITVWRPPNVSSRLLFDLEPGPSAGGKSILLQVLDDATRVLAQTVIKGRTKVSLQLPANGSRSHSFRLHVVGGGLPVSGDPRILNFRVFRCECEPGWPCSEVDRDRAAIRDGAARDIFMRIDPGPDADVKAIELVVRDSSGKILARAAADRFQCLEVPVPWQPGRTLALFLTLEGGDSPPRADARSLNLHLAAWRQADAQRDAEASLPGRSSEQDWPINIIKSRPTVDWAASDQSPHPAGAEMRNAMFLHTNACGDFTLMAREHWFALRGYPEFPVWPLHIDAILCCSAHHAGVREEILREPLRIYHIQHGQGAGWTPEGEAQLYAGIAAKGLSYVHYKEVVGWLSQMRRLNSPMIFNRENWGLSDLELLETPLPRRGASQTGT